MASSINVAVGQGGLQICDTVLSIARRAEETRARPELPDSRKKRKPPGKTKAAAAAPSLHRPSEFPLGSARRALFHRDGRARTIFADTEPRVVHEFVNDVRRDWVGDKNTVCEQAGRGNNWAEGYFQSADFVSATLEAVRHEVEACDWFQSAYVYHSLGGGTGSGSGSRLIKKMRDAYPRCCIGSVAIAPSGSCESPIFTYNTMLSLWQLQQHSSAILLFSNDDLEARAAQSRQFLSNNGGSGGPKQPSSPKTKDGSLSALAGTARGIGMAQSDMKFAMSDLNQQAALALCGLVYPMEVPQPSTLSGKVVGSHGLPNIVSDVAPVEDLKYIDIRSSYFSLPSEKSWRRRAMQGPATGESWARAAKLLMRRTPKFDDENKPIVTLASQILLRGGSHGTHAPWSPKIGRRLFDFGNPAPWNMLCDTRVRESSVDALGTRSITCVANRSHVAAMLRRIHNKAGDMFSAGAWVHWYEQAGLEKADWLESFGNAQKVVEAYSAAAQPSPRGT